MKPRWKQSVERVRSGRVRILWLVMGAMVLISALPIGLYHRQVLQLSQDKLLDTERVQQSDLTRSVAQEVQSFDSTITQQLLSEQQILELAGAVQDVSDPAAEPKVTRLLENFVETNRSSVLYVTAVGTNKKGTSASQGNFRAEQDPFVSKVLNRAFETTQQSSATNFVKFRSDPLAVTPKNDPAFIVAIPLMDHDKFSGMLAAVVSFRPILQRLQDASVRGRTVFIVDHNGKLIAHPETRKFSPGEDAGTNPVVSKIMALPQALHNTETIRFTDRDGKKA